MLLRLEDNTSFAGRSGSGYTYSMPPIPRAFTGPVTSRNALGVSPRTLGGVFDVPVVFTAFGSTTANPFNPGTTVTLATVNLPAYTLAEGSVARMRYAGRVTWEAAPPAADAIFLRLEGVTGAAPILMGGGVPPGAAGATAMFAGEFELVALEPPSAASKVAISAEFVTIGVVGSTSPVATTHQGANGIGIGVLDTGGCPTGIDIKINADMSNNGVVSSVRRIELYLLTFDLLS